MVHPVPLGLLRRHVGHRPHRSPRPGHSRGPRQPRQPEVHDLDHPIFGHQNVGGFDIPVNDFMLVGFFQTAGYLDSDVHCLLDCQRPLLDPGLQAFPAVVSHGNVHLPGFGLVKLVDSADIGMVQLGGRLGLMNKPLVSFPVAG